MTIPHIGAFHNRKYFEQYGMFDPTYKIAGDYELLLRAKQQLKTHAIDRFTVVMGLDGVSNNYIKQVYSETTRAKLETAQLPWLWCKIDFVVWIVKFWIKKGINALA